MCEVALPLAAVPAVAREVPELAVPAESGHDQLPPGFITLSEEEYSAAISSEPIENLYEVYPTPISTGQWASVYKCRLRSTGAEFAAKFCDKWRLGADASREIVHEMAVMHRCRGCARVVRLQQLFETPTQFVLVMELGCGGDLQGVLDSDQVPYEPDVIRFVRNLLEGLIFLHEQDIAHMDIKPQNLVLTGPFPDCDVKLCDLEISRQLRPGREVRDMLGTPDYVAPEILRFDPVTLAADLWSVGVLAYVLLTGFTPFGGDTDAETFRNIASAEPEFPDELFEDVSEAAKDFVRSCLHKQPSARPTCQQLLQHRWLQPAASPSGPPALSSFLSVPSGSELNLDTYQPGTLRRSISKSREVLSVKVSRSNLKKNISKSRDRLCDMKFGVAKSASVDQFPLTLRASMSRLPDASGGRPPWRGGGVLCTAPSPNTFQVRDQYHNQVASVLGGGRSTPEGASSPQLVRQNSQRGRRKSSTPQAETGDWRGSLRQNRKSSDSAIIRRNSQQNEPGSGQNSAGTSPEVSPRLGEKNRRNSRKQSLIPVDENKAIMERLGSQSESVFSRLAADSTRRNSQSVSPRRPSVASGLHSGTDLEEDKFITSIESCKNKNTIKIRRLSSSQESLESTTSTLSCDSGIVVSTSPRHMRPMRSPSVTRRASVTKGISTATPSASSPTSARTSDKTESDRRRSESSPLPPRRSSPMLRRASVATLSVPATNKRVASPKRQSSVPLITQHLGAKSGSEDPAPATASVRGRLASIQDEEEILGEKNASVDRGTATKTSRSPSLNSKVNRRTHEPIFECATTLRSSRRDSANQVTRTATSAAARSSPGEDGNQLKKSSTDEDVRLSVLRAQEKKRSVPSLQATAHVSRDRLSTPGRSSSLSARSPSSYGSDTSSDCSDLPGITDRIGRPRVPEERPARICGGAVSHAVSRFRALAEEARQRDHISGSRSVSPRNRSLTNVISSGSRPANASKAHSR